MAARTTMAGLIERLRRMVGDPAGTEQAWSDAELQDALDVRRRDERQVELHGSPTIGPGGTVAWLEYSAERGDWEAGAALQDASWGTLTPSAEDGLRGSWRLAESAAPPVRATGRSYDLAGSAADVLLEWAAREKAAMDFSAGDQRFERSQRVRQMVELARVMRQRQRPMRCRVASHADRR